MGSANVTLYAVWNPSLQAITYSNNGGTGSISPTSGNTGSLINLSNGSGFTITGYIIASWNTAANGSGVSYTLGQSSLTMPAEGFILYAQWLSTGMEVSNSKFGKLKFDVFFDLNGVKLDSEDKRLIRTSYRSIQSKLTSKSVVTVVVYGWVQPTNKSPNVLWLSENRAKAVVAYLKELGLKARYTMKTPGHDVKNISYSRRATTFVEWSNSK